jgi:hypothetical protein
MAGAIRGPGRRIGTKAKAKWARRLRLADLKEAKPALPKGLDREKNLELAVTIADTCHIPSELSHFVPGGVS